MELGLHRKRDASSEHRLCQVRGSLDDSEDFANGLHMDIIPRMYFPFNKEVLDSLGAKIQFRQTKAPWLLGGCTGNMRDPLSPDRTSLFHTAFGPAVLCKCQLRQLRRRSSSIGDLSVAHRDGRPDPASVPCESHRMLTLRHDPVLRSLQRGSSTLSRHTRPLSRLRSALDCL